MKPGSSRAIWIALALALASLFWFRQPWMEGASRTSNPEVVEALAAIVEDAESSSTTRSPSPSHPNDPRIASAVAADIVVSVRSSVPGPSARLQSWSGASLGDVWNARCGQEATLNRSLGALPVEASVPTRQPSWTVVRVECGDRRIQRTIPPFVGQRAIEIDVDRGRYGLDVVVLRSDFVSVASHADVELLSVPPSVSQPSRLELLRTDEHGFVRFDALSPGAFVVRTPGLTVGDVPPHARRMMLGPNAETIDRTCILVIPERTTRVSVRTTGDLGPVGGVDGTLVLRRLDPGREGIYPLLRMQSGSAERSVEVPLGSYAVESLPQGCVEVSFGALLRLDGEADSSVHAVHFAARRPSARWELRGVREADYPLQVWFEAHEEQGAGELAPVHIGPWHWRIPHMDIAPLPNRGRVLARGRRAFVSARSVDGAVAANQVDLVPARKVRVEFQRSLPITTACAIFVEDGLHSVQLAAVPMVIDRDGISGVARIAETLIGTGAATLECVSGDGETLWTRTVPPGTSDEIVRVLGG